jgi:hypothetical protein
MEEEIEILTRYGKAGFSKRLHLFLQFPGLRWAFQEVELRHLGGEHNKGKRSRLLSFLRRIIEIKIEPLDLTWSFQEIELKELNARRALVSPTQQHHKGKCSLLQSLLGRIFDIEVSKNQSRNAR